MYMLYNDGRRFNGKYELHLIIKGQVRLLISGHWVVLLSVYVQRGVKRLRLDWVRLEELYEEIIKIKGWEV